MDGADTDPMIAAPTKIERSGPAIHAVLAELAPDESAEFETEFRDALACAETDFGLAPAEAVLDRRWGPRRSPPTRCPTTSTTTSIAPAPATSRAG